MKKILKFKKEFILLLIIISLASVLRLWQLGSVPVSMTDDEIRESYTAYSIAHTGRDIFGNFLPVVIKMDGYNNWGTSIYYLRAPFSLILPLTPFTARLPDALSGIFCVILIYLIVKKLLNEQVALFSAFALSVSVWNLQLSRIDHEPNITALLYLFGILLYIYSKNKTKFLILSMIIFSFAFYGYSAYRVFFLPLMFILIWYKFKEQSKKKILIILTTIFLVLGSYGSLSITQDAANYAGVPFYFLDHQKTSLAVELERRYSNEPPIIKILYHNKFTYWGRIFATNYLTAFSPQYLLLNQEASGIFSIWGRGEMYLIELPLFIFGVFYLFSKKRKEFYLILMLLLISPLPSAVGVGDGTWQTRSAFMVYWLYVFVGAGIYYLLTLFRRQRLRYIVFIVICLIYTYSVLGYTFQYYYDWSKINSKYFRTTTKDLVYATNKYVKEGKRVIISGVRPVDFLHFAFYNKIDPKIVQSKINKFPIKLNNVTYAQDCLISPLDNPYKFIPLDTVYISNVVCEYKVKPIAKITTYQNETVMWNIYLKQ